MCQHAPALTGLQKCHLHALCNVSKSTLHNAKAVSLGVKSSDKSKVKECLLFEAVHGKVYMLENSHWVALTTKCYVGDASCCHVVNHEDASFILELIESGYYAGGAAC